MYIYSITNSINNKVYIGSSTSFNRRKSQHIKELTLNIHNNVYLQDDFNKYGLSNFEFNILYKFENKVSKTTLLLKEKEYLDKYNPKIVYNIDLTIIGNKYKYQSKTNNKYRYKNKSLVGLLTNYKEFDDVYIKKISVEYRIPIKTVIKTLNNLINSNKIIKKDNIYLVN